MQTKSPELEPTIRSMNIPLKLYTKKHLISFKDKIKYFEEILGRNNFNSTWCPEPVLVQPVKRKASYSLKEPVKNQSLKGQPLLLIKRKDEQPKEINGQFEPMENFSVEAFTDDSSINDDDDQDMI